MIALKCILVNKKKEADRTDESFMDPVEAVKT